MCCEQCPNYEKCEEGNRLKDNCCSKCPEYYDCMGIDAREESPSRSSYRHRDSEDYFDN